MNNKTVLILDDDDAVRDSLQALIESEDYSVKTYHSSVEFLEQLDELEGHCLVLDIRMPLIDGLQVQQELVAKNIRLPIIMITGHGDVPIAIQAMKMGAFDFIEKPFTDEVILGSIKQAFDHHQHLNHKQQCTDKLKEKFDKLTPREIEVLKELVEGFSNKVIAQNLAISPRTVEIHRAKVMDKMGARNVSHLIRMALSLDMTVHPE